MNNKKEKCFIIGNTTLLIKCAECLINNEFNILGIISRIPVIADWAKINNISLIDPEGDYYSVLKKIRFDYLFSIVNPKILSREILELPEKQAINFHDSLLPKYAGKHSTSWALINQEKYHGVSWHVINPEIDEGEILKQEKIEIFEADTAFDLNLRCYETAYKLFEELINDIKNDNPIKGKKQDLKQKTYYANFKRPLNGCLICWSWDAKRIDALVRALNFGINENQIGTAKFSLENDYIVINKMKILNSQSNEKPGTIINISEQGIIISTGTNNIEVEKLSYINGVPLSLSDLTDKYKLYTGFVLNEFDSLKLSKLNSLYNSTCKHEKYWIDKLMDLDILTYTGAYNVKNPYVKTKNSITAINKIKFPENIMKFIKTHDDPKELLTTLFSAFLHRLTYNERFGIGIKDNSVLNEFKDFFGFYSDTLPLRVDINKESKMTELLQNIKIQMHNLKKRLTYPADIFARYKDLNKEKYNYPIWIGFTDNVSAYNLQPDAYLGLIADTETEQYYWLFDESKISKELVDNYNNQFIIFINNYLSNMDITIREISRVSDAEKEKILFIWNNTDKKYSKESIIKLFENQSKNFPDAEAVVYEGHGISFNELNRRANKIASYLIKKGIGSDSIVGLYIERSVDLIIGLFGILKAGGAYLPLSIKYPPKRIKYMIEDAKSAIVLTHNKNKNVFYNMNIETICIDSDWDQINIESDNNPNIQYNLDSLAYVIYTSGSTGEPKGVKIKNDSVLNLFYALNDTVYTEDNKKPYNISVNGSISFDTSVKQWLQLLNGHTLHIIPEFVRLDARALKEFIENNQIDIFDTTPSLFKILLKSGILNNSKCSLKKVLIGGEQIDNETWKELGEKKSIDFYNLYGPTECTVDSTVCKIGFKNQKSNIGRPIPNVKIYILDKFLQIVPIGVAGEIYIGGKGLSRGYIGNKDSINNQFIPNPFVKESLLYKSGDIARYLPDGDIEYLGRMDQQVKIRGYRIELPEIESVILKYKSVKSVIVKDIEFNSLEGNKILAAYLIIESQNKLQLSKLKEFLSERLPDYMIPAEFIIIDKIPLTHNGKIDYNALPIPDRDQGSMEQQNVPVTRLETFIANEWKKSLNVNQLNINENFFEKGGHSLLAMQITAQLQEYFETEIPLISLFFEGPTVKQFAEAIKENLENKDELEKILDGLHPVKLEKG